MNLFTKRLRVVVLTAGLAAALMLAACDKKPAKEGGANAQYPEMAELEAEAATWKDDKVDWTINENGVTSYQKSGQFFDFSGTSAEGEGELSATSKKQIGDCPAGSVWSVSGDQQGWGKFEIPQNCASITPKSITDF